MKNQVLSIEQMQHLQELGVDTSKAKMAWYATYESEPNWYNMLRERDNIFDNNCPHIPALTLQEMLEMMLYEIRGYFFDQQTAILKIIPVSDNKYIVSCIEQKYYRVIYESKNPSDLLTCAYETLCWLAENEFIGDKK
jgi:hypothetical protein